MSELESKYIAKAKRVVLDQFPEMAGAKSAVSEKRNRSKGKGDPKPSTGSIHGTRYIIRFEKDVCLPGGGKLKRLVRVTMDEDGEVVKLTSSK